MPARAGPIWNAVAAVSQQPRTRILFASGVFRNKWRMSLHALAADASCNALERPRSARSPRKCTWCLSSPQQTLRFCARVWKHSAPKFLHACFTTLLRQSYAIATRGRLVRRQIHNARQLEVLSQTCNIIKFCCLRPGAVHLAQPRLDRPMHVVAVFKFKRRLVLCLRKKCARAERRSPPQITERKKNVENDTHCQLFRHY